MNLMHAIAKSESVAVRMLAQQKGVGADEVKP
jgi:hypothetical protein